MVIILKKINITLFYNYNIRKDIDMKIKITNLQNKFYNPFNTTNCKDFINQFYRVCDKPDLIGNYYNHLEEIWEHLKDNTFVDDTEYTGYIFINCD